MSKQTAVQWVFNSMANVAAGISNLTSHEILEQGLAMEKKQIADAFGVGCQVESTRLVGYHSMADQYYNETYGGDK